MDKQFEWLLTRDASAVGGEEQERVLVAVQGSLPEHLVGCTVGWRPTSSPVHRFLTLEQHSALLRRAVLRQPAEPFAARQVEPSLLGIPQENLFGQQLLVVLDAGSDKRGGPTALVCVVRDVLRTEALFAITNQALGLERPLARVHVSDEYFSDD